MLAARAAASTSACEKVPGLEGEGGREGGREGGWEGGWEGEGMYRERRALKRMPR